MTPYQDQVISKMKDWFILLVAHQAFDEDQAASEAAKLIELENYSFTSEESKKKSTNGRPMIVVDK